MEKDSSMATLKDQTIFNLVQLLQAKESELNDIRAENKALRGTVENVKLKVKDTSVQTDNSGLGNIDYVGAIEKVHQEHNVISGTKPKLFPLEVASKYGSKQPENDIFDSGLSDIVTDSYEEDEFTKQRDSDSSFDDCDDDFVTTEHMKRNESIKPIKKLKKRRIRSCVSRKLSFKKGPKDETTQNNFVRYQFSRKSIRRKESSRESGKKNIKEDWLSAGTKKTTSNSDQLSTSKGMKSRMNLIKTCHYSDLECQPTAVNNTINNPEINCHELNKDSTSLKTTLSNTSNNDENDIKPNDPPEKRYDTRKEFEKKYQFWEAQVNDDASTGVVQYQISGVGHTFKKGEDQWMDDATKITFV